MSRPELMLLPPQFGHRWVNPWRIDSIEVNKGGTEHVVTLRVREQRIRSVEGLKLTADQAADLVANLLAMIRRGDG